MVSKTKLDLVEENFGQVKEKLQQYLLDQGFESRNGAKFKCINPEHNDKSPSMSVFTHDNGYPLARCNSCGFIADIFTAAHVLEEKPVTGPGFLHENVKYLADKYGVEVKIGALTEEELYEISTYEAYKATASFISASTYSPKCITEIENRHWSEDFAREYMVACCVDYHALRAHLKGLGFAARFLDEIDLDNQKIFNQDNLIFTISDEHGRPVGFSGRNLDYDPDSPDKKNGPPKFTNTKTTGLRCNIFRKSERLYLIHIAKKHITSSDPLYLVEGYGDALTLHSNGMKNAVAVNCADINDKQLNLCRKLGISDIVICLDGDETGITKGQKILDEVLKNVHDLRIRFVFMPYDGKVKTDPDKFVRDNGLKAFLDIPKVEPFSWRLQQFIDQLEAKNGKVTDSDAQFICQTMIPIIANEPSALKRETMMRELSVYTSYSFAVLKEEVDKILNAETAVLQKKKKAVMDNLITVLNSRTDNYEGALEKAFQDLEDVNRESKSDMFEVESIVSSINTIKHYQENEQEHRTTSFGTNFNTLPIALSGDLSQKVIYIGGTPNTGKSSIFSNLALNLPFENEDMTTIIMTIDDTNKEYVSRLVCYDMAKRFYQRGDMDLFDCLNLNKVAQPFMFKHLEEYTHLQQERETSFRNITSLIQEGRFGVFDSTYGKSLGLMRTITKKFKQNRPDQKIILFLDNFHQLESISQLEGRHKYKELSAEVKNLADTQGHTIVSTVEYNKIPPGTKPNNFNVGESGALEYDCKAMMHLYNELHDIRDKSKLYFEENNMKYPIIEQIVSKNKISSFKGNIWYKFYGDKSFFLEISEEEKDEIKQGNSFTPTTNTGFDFGDKTPISIGRRD